MDEQTAQIYVKAVAKALVACCAQEAEMWLAVVETCYGPEAMADVAVAAYSYL